MYGINYLLIVNIVVLINMFKNRIDKYLVKVGYTENNGRLQVE